MRKKKVSIERERQAQIAQEARIRASLRWSDESDVEPDVPPPEWGQELTTGFVFNAYAHRTDVACSSSVYHSIGRTDKAAYQLPLALYSTRERALRALRVALEREFAEELAKIDAQLESETRRWTQ